MKSIFSAVSMLPVPSAENPADIKRITSLLQNYLVLCLRKYEIKIKIKDIFIFFLGFNLGPKASQGFSQVSNMQIFITLEQLFDQNASQII